MLPLGASEQLQSFQPCCTTYGAQRHEISASGGVSEGEIMRLCGWKTRAMFDRYNIIDEADLAQGGSEAVCWPNNGQQKANNGKH